MRRIVLALFFSSVAVAAPNTATCVACHGPKGVSANPAWPNLAGQGRDYLVKQLKAFRSGERKDPLMGPVSATLSDADVESLADFYSKLSR